MKNFFKKYKIGIGAAGLVAMVIISFQNCQKFQSELVSGSTLGDASDPSLDAMSDEFNYESTLSSNPLGIQGFVAKAVPTCAAGSTYVDLRTVINERMAALKESPDITVSAWAEDFDTIDAEERDGYLGGSCAEVYEPGARYDRTMDAVLTDGELSKINDLPPGILDPNSIYTYGAKVVCGAPMAEVASPGKYLARCCRLQFCKGASIVYPNPTPTATATPTSTRTL